MVMVRLFEGSPDKHVYFYSILLTLMSKAVYILHGLQNTGLHFRSIA